MSMETVYEVWVKRGYSKGTEDKVVPVDPDDPKQGQKVIKKEVKLEGDILEPVLDKEDDTPLQHKDINHMEGVAKQQLSDEGVSRVYLRKIETVKEFVRPEAAAAPAPAPTETPK